MNNYINALFAVKEDGEVQSLVVKKVQKHRDKYCSKYKLGKKTWSNEFGEGEYDFYFDCFYEVDEHIPEDKELSLYLKGQSSSAIENLFKSNGIGSDIVGFLILKYYAISQDWIVLEETEIYNRHDSFETNPMAKAEKIIPKNSGILPCENDFDNSTNKKFHLLHKYNAVTERDRIYYEHKCDNYPITYGSKNGKFYERTSVRDCLKEYNCYDGDCYNEEENAKWDETFKHLDTYYCYRTVVRCLESFEISKTLDMLEKYKKKIEKEKEQLINEANEHIDFILNHISDDNEKYTS